MKICHWWNPLRVVCFKNRLLGLFSICSLDLHLEHPQNTQSAVAIQWCLISGDSHNTHSVSVVKEEKKTKTHSPLSSLMFDLTCTCDKIKKKQKKQANTQKMPFWGLLYILRLTFAARFIYLFIFGGLRELNAFLVAVFTKNIVHFNFLLKKCKNASKAVFCLFFYVLVEFTDLNKQLIKWYDMLGSNNFLSSLAPILVILQFVALAFTWALL